AAAALPDRTSPAALSRRDGSRSTAHNVPFNGPQRANIQRHVLAAGKLLQWQSNEKRATSSSTRATPTLTPIGHLREREDRPENQETPPQPIEDQQSRHSVTNAVRVVITESRVSTAERRRRKDTGVTSSAQSADPAATEPPVSFISIAAATTTTTITTFAIKYFAIAITIAVAAAFPVVIFVAKLTAPSVPGDVSCFRHTHQSNEPFRDGKATEAAASEQEQQQPSTSVASASSSSTHPSSLYVYTPVSESAVSTSSYVTAATGLEDLPSNDPTFARHVANNDPEGETMLSGDHINSGQDSAGLSVDSDADSAMGDITGALSTSSLRSSIYNYIEEHGRTFHRYKQGKYWMPNDKIEQDRLDLQHAVFMRMLKGKFGLAPVTNPQSVLDIGTGTGIWAIEFAIQNPAAHVVGTDLSPIQPEYVPPNCHFEIDDAEDEWIFSQQFDYVHVRLLFHAFNSHKEVMMSAFRQLNPGGWMEWQDYYPHIQSVDGSIAGTALERWSRMYIEGGQRLGRDMLAPRRYKQWMEEAGFINVVEEKLVIPGNPWPKGKEQKVTGVWQMTNFLEGLHAMSMTIFTKGLGMSPEAVEVFLVDVRKDIRNLRIHFYFLTYFVYGQKPPISNYARSVRSSRSAAT
ncbi:S-adenosyl-L-methionine-dependent methyltransferase, partial [Neurospora tetrasperma FGSC 2509]